MAGDTASIHPKGQAWFCSTGLPSDLVIQVDHMTFHLHKFPFKSKSKKLNELIMQQERERSQTKHDNENNDEQQQCHVSLTNFPGGSETFETVAKFCYGMKIELTAENAAPLRCAGEALEMTEEYPINNLVSKTQTYLDRHVFTNMKDSIKTLKSCETLLPLAENLGIVDRCVVTISSKASLYDPTLFGWPINTPASHNRETTAKIRQPWFDDLAKLNLSMFNRVISAMKEKETNQDLVENCLVHYAKQCFPGINRINGTPKVSSSSTIASEAEQREKLEFIISNLPFETRLRSPVETSFLFGMLRTANMLCVSEASKRILERKIGDRLEEVTLDDLLITSYSYLNETLYDVDCVERILDYFLEKRENVSSSSIMLVGKLIDGYLSEIASDSNLKTERFCELVVSLPEQARLYDDGVYRAVDVYFKAHPWVTEEERDKISGVMNYEKLTLEACTHAAQNERLPLRAIIQVLFFEQLQLRQAIAGSLLASEATVTDEEKDDIRTTTPTIEDEHGSKSCNSREENQVLRLDMDSMRTRVHELERECSTMKKFIDKIDTMNVQQNDESKKGWKNKALITRKFGCKFRIQVCDSHESVAVDVRKAKHLSNNHHQR